MLCLLPAAMPLVAGEVIDGVVATVNRQPIFQSDWDEAICFEAFMQQKPLNQVTQADRISALQRLIDRQLLRSQMADPTYMQPSQEELRQDMAKLRAQVPGGADDEKWQAVLANYGFERELDEGAPEDRGAGDELRRHSTASQCACAAGRDRILLQK